jgi:hypothetical protein
MRAGGGGDGGYHNVLHAGAASLAQDANCMNSALQHLWCTCNGIQTVSFSALQPRQLRVQLHSVRPHVSVHGCKTQSTHIMAHQAYPNNPQTPYASGTAPSITVAGFAESTQLKHLECYVQTKNPELSIIALNFLLLSWLRPVCPGKHTGKA